MNSYGLRFNQFYFAHWTKNSDDGNDGNHNNGSNGDNGGNGDNNNNNNNNQIPDTSTVTLADTTIPTKTKTSDNGANKLDAVLKSGDTSKNDITGFYRYF